MTEAAAAGSMSSGAVKEVQQSISQIASDMAKLEKSAKEFAKHMKSAATAASGGGWGGGGLTTQSIGAGGYGPSMGIEGGTISDTGSMNPGVRSAPSFWKQAGSIGLQTVKGMGVGMINDLRPTAEEATNYEWLSRRARSMTGDYSRFTSNIQAGINQYNIMNKDLYMGDVAEVLHMGAGASMGIGRGSAIGERLASQNVGAFHTVASMNGLDASTVLPAYQGIYSPQAYYRALAGGIQTRGANGRQVSLEEIANQYYNTRYKGMSLEELELGFEYGGMGMYELTSTYGAEGADYIRSAIMERARVGQDLKPETWEAQMRASGAAGTKYTQGLDSRSKLHGAQIGVLGEYQFDVTNGVRTANDAMAELNTQLANLTGLARDAAGAIATLGGMGDAFATSMPGTTSAVTGGMGALWGLGTAALGARLGGKAATAGGGRAALGAIARSPLMRGLGVIGGGLAAWDSGTNAWNAWKNDAVRGEQLDKGDWWTTVASRTGQGALAGTVVPGWGNVIGGGIGLAFGIAEAVIRELNDTDNIEDTKGRAKGDWFVEKDQDTRIHQGEMVLPSRIAQSVRDELDSGRRAKDSSGKSVVIHLTIQNASESEAMRFAGRVKRILDDDNELVEAGEGKLR